MKKVLQDPRTIIIPEPVVLVSCCRSGERPNIVTVAWPGGLCASPPILGFPLTRERYSHGIISDSREFVLNLPTMDRLFDVDYCGSVSGRTHDKFSGGRWTAIPSVTLQQTPLIDECPVSLECQVIDVVEYGTHDYFVARVTASHVAEDWTDASGRFKPRVSDLITYAAGEYYQVGRCVGRRGFSIRPVDDAADGR